MYGVIYKITNTITGKIYIGQTTKFNNPEKRIKQHFKKNTHIDLVSRSYFKYNKNKSIFFTEVLCSAKKLDIFSII